MTQPDPRDPENRQQNRFSERRFSEKKTPVTTGWMGKRGLSANNAQFIRWLNRGKESSHIRIVKKYGVPLHNFTKNGLEVQATIKFLSTVL